MILYDGCRLESCPAKIDFWATLFPALVLQVEKHIRRLDDDLLRFEEEQMTGPKLVAVEPKQGYRDERPTSVTVANRPRRGGNSKNLFLVAESSLSDVSLYNLSSHCSCLKRG